MSGLGARLILGIASIGAMLFMLAVADTPDAYAKKGKIHTCIDKKGPDKGAMRFSKIKRCRKGEKSLSWNKRGLPGQAGQPGPAGATGTGGDPGALDELRLDLDQQSARIQELEGEVDALTTQVTALAAQLTGLGTQLGALGSDFTSFKSDACDQLETLTDQSNSMGTALDGIGLGGTIPPLLTLTNPGSPTALPAFGC